MLCTQSYALEPLDWWQEGREYLWHSLLASSDTTSNHFHMLSSFSCFKPPWKEVGPSIRIIIKGSELWGVMQTLLSGNLGQCNKPSSIKTALNRRADEHSNKWRVNMNPRRKDSQSTRWRLTTMRKYIFFVIKWKPVCPFSYPCSRMCLQQFHWEQHEL